MVYTLYLDQFSQRQMETTKKKIESKPIVITGLISFLTLSMNVNHKLKVN